MMELNNKRFFAHDIAPSELAEYLNGLAEEGQNLHSMHLIGGDSPHPRFMVISYEPYNWAVAELLEEKEWEAAIRTERLVEKEAEEYWAAKIAEKKGGHANE
jgi:hypothetical protein